MAWQWIGVKPLSKPMMTKFYVYMPHFDTMAEEAMCDRCKIKCSTGLCWSCSFAFLCKLSTYSLHNWYLWMHYGGLTLHFDCSLQMKQIWVILANGSWGVSRRRLQRKRFHQPARYSSFYGIEVCPYTPVASSTALSRLCAIGCCLMCVSVHAWENILSTPKLWCPIYVVCLVLEQKACFHNVQAFGHIRKDDLFLVPGYNK